MASHILQLFPKYNKNYQNVNSKRLQLTTVYFLTLNGYLAIFFILKSDIHTRATRVTPQWNRLNIG
jgi:hypothetical protein